MVSPAVQREGRSVGNAGRQRFVRHLAPTRYLAFMGYRPECPWPIAFVGDVGLLQVVTSGSAGNSFCDDDDPALSVQRGQLRLCFFGETCETCVVDGASFLGGAAEDAPFSL